MSSLVDRTAVEEFRRLVTRRLGLVHDDGRLDQLADVLRRRIEASGIGESAGYLRRLGQLPPGDDELARLAEELTVGETFFFRNADHFRAFAEQVLPERIERRAPERRLRILSLGCATGEEAYTIAILIRAGFPALAQWDVQIVGADINRAALARAASGRYSPWSLRATPLEVQVRYFRGEGRDQVLDPEIRSMVTLRELNLADDDPGFWSATGWDVVFWRNVLMYLAPEVTRRIARRIDDTLVPGGYLFLGHAETLRAVSQDFHLCHTHDTFYYRRRDGTGAAPRRVEPQAMVAATPIAIDPGASWVDVIQRASDRIAALTGARRQASPVDPRTASPAPRRWDLDVILELTRQEQFAEALRHMEALPADSRDDPDALLLRAVLLTNVGVLAEAEAVCARLLSIAELDAGPHYVMALCREHAGDRARAIDHDQTAIYLDPSFAMPHLHLGLLAKRSGDLDATRRSLGQALLLLAREDAARLVLFGGGFSREMLVDLCRAEPPRRRRWVVTRVIDRAAELRRAFDRSFAEAPAGAPTDHVDLLAIRVAGEPYAIRVLDVRELARCGKVVGVPAETRGLLGLAGVRGGIVPVFSLAELLGHGAPTAAPPWMVICGVDDPIGLAFDGLDRHLRVVATAIHTEARVGEAVRLGEAVRPVIGVARLVASLRKVG